MPGNERVPPSVIGLMGFRSATTAYLTYRRALETRAVVENGTRLIDFVKSSNEDR